MVVGGLDGDETGAVGTTAAAVVGVGSWGTGTMNRSGAVAAAGSALGASANRSGEMVVAAPAMAAMPSQQQRAPEGTRVRAPDRPRPARTTLSAVRRASNQSSVAQVTAMTELPARSSVTAVARATIRSMTTTT